MQEPRTPHTVSGPIVISVAAGIIVLLSGLFVNGCQISRLLSRSSGGARVESIVVTPPEVVDSALAGETAPRVTNLAVSNDVDAAFEELDKRYLAGEGKPHVATIEPMYELLAAYNRQDWARWRALLAEETFEIDACYGWFDRRRYSGGEDTIWVTSARE